MSSKKRVFGLFLLVSALGCGGAGGLSPAETAKRTFEGEQAACVAAYDTAVEIDACRATVHRLWGQPVRSKPAGPAPRIDFTTSTPPGTGDGGLPAVRSSPEADAGGAGAKLYREGGF